MFRSIRFRALMALVLLPARAFAHEVSPTVSIIEVPGGQSGVSLTVHNPGAKELPVTMEMVERFIAEDGSETSEPADDLFVVFPPQAVIPPGKSQAVRVQWVGEPPKTSRSFHMFASEVAVPLSADAPSQVQTVMRIGASIHVAPVSSQARPVLVTSRPENGNVLLTLANEGERFFYIDSLALDVGGKRISGPALADAAGRTLVPPGGRRTFTIKDVAGTPVLAKP